VLFVSSCLQPCEQNSASAATTNKQFSAFRMTISNRSRANPGALTYDFRSNSHDKQPFVTTPTILVAHNTPGETAGDRPSIALLPPASARERHGGGGTHEAVPAGLPARNVPGTTSLRHAGLKPNPPARPHKRMDFIRASFEGHGPATPAT
jgi:hypothetical protein